MKNSDIIDTLRHELGISAGNSQLGEAYVAQPKQFDGFRPTKLVDADVSQHFELYKQYVGKFNEISATLDSVDRSSPSQVGQYGRLKRDEVYTLNSVYLHELFFRNIGKAKSQVYTDSRAFMRLNAAFGTFKKWQDDFIASALSAREGWVMSVGHTFLRNYVNVVVDDNASNVPLGSIPVIVVDMHTHSFAATFGNDRRAYVMSIMAELDWDVIEERVERVDRMFEVLK
jgi:Fe-Mn family superoxide dismutase